MQPVNPKEALMVSKVDEQLREIIINGTSPGEFGYAESGLEVTDECIAQIKQAVLSAVPEKTIGAPVDHFHSGVLIDAYKEGYNQAISEH